VSLGHARAKGDDSYSSRKEAIDEWRLPHASAKAAVVSIDLKFFRGASTLHWAAYHMENYAEI